MPIAKRTKSYYDNQTGKEWYHLDLEIERIMRREAAARRWGITVEELQKRAEKGSPYEVIRNGKLYNPYWYHGI